MVGDIGAWIAYSQYRTAKDKLSLDLFEKRLAVYEKLQGYFIELGSTKLAIALKKFEINNQPRSVC